MATLVCKFQINTRLDLIIAWHVRRCKQPTTITPHEQTKHTAQRRRPRRRPRGSNPGTLFSDTHNPHHTGRRCRRRCTPWTDTQLHPLQHVALRPRLHAISLPTTFLPSTSGTGRTSSQVGQSLGLHIPGRFIFSWVRSKGLTYTGRTDGIVGCLILLHIFKRV